MSITRPPVQARLLRIAAALILWLAAPCVLADAAGIRLTDDTGREVVLAEPARRVVSLAPHITELLFHVGAGDRIVGTVTFSDHPPEAADLPLVGDGGHIDLESVLALRPDLVVAWHTGNPRRQVARIEALGIPVFRNEPRGIDELAESMVQLSMLTGTDARGRVRAGELRARRDALRSAYAGRAPVRLFYQVWDSPLMTINDEHLIGELIRLCGGRNVFGELPALVPRVSLEAVLAADPEVIAGGGSGEDDHSWVESWRRWDSLTAVRNGNLLFIPPSLIQRHTPRVLDGAAMLCAFLDDARARRPGSGP
jgi:iron complex transport system substrate-binding protein